MKRLRQDEGQLSKEEYEERDRNEPNETVLHFNIKFTHLVRFFNQVTEFTRGPQHVISKRRIVSAQRIPIEGMTGNKKEQFMRHVLVLNKSFTEWFKLQMSTSDDPSNCDLVDGFQVIIAPISMFTMQ
jgi:hypothetical protein